MMKMIKPLSRWIFTLLLLLVAAGSYRLYLSLTDGFSLNSISYEISYHPEWEVPSLSSSEYTQLQALLNQPYTYLGKGAQSYVFSSADQKYVLKFFKFKHLLPNPLINVVPNWPNFLTHWKQNYYSHKLYRLHTLFDGHHLAYTQDREHSALVYIHLNTTIDTDLKTLLIDKLGRQNRIDLDALSFVVQKKGETARALIKASLAIGDVEGAWQKIESILDMIILEYKQGLYDRDHGVLHNTGFVDGTPFHLDVGKLTFTEEAKNPSFQRDDIYKIVHRILPWIRHNYPEFSVRLEERIDAHLKTVLDPTF